MNIFYIYAYLRKDGSPYYIGKGKEYRMYNQKGHNISPPRDKSLIVMMENNLTEIGALALERFYIRWYGRKDIGTGILRNMTDGGEGTSGWIPSEDTRKKISQSKINPSQETRKRLSLSKIGKKSWCKGKKMNDEFRKNVSLNHADITGNKNPMYGKKHSPETLEKMRKKALERESRKRLIQ